jgi:hypothetical protein
MPVVVCHSTWRWRSVGLTFQTSHQRSAAWPAMHSCREACRGSPFSVAACWQTLPAGLRQPPQNAASQRPRAAASPGCLCGLINRVDAAEDEYCIDFSRESRTFAHSAGSPRTASAFPPQTGADHPRWAVQPAASAVALAAGLAAVGPADAHRVRCVRTRAPGAGRTKRSSGWQPTTETA